MQSVFACPQKCFLKQAEYACLMGSEQSSARASIPAATMEKQCWHDCYAGPHLLDLGDCLYAPNCFRDAEGRNIMLAWLQELRKGGAFDYAGCISLPRVLTYRGTCQSEAACMLPAGACCCL